jgi:excisionase family DNA binding protein
MWQLRQLSSKEDVLDSEMKPGREARRTRTHERSSGAEMHDRIGHAHVPMNSYWDVRELSVYLHVKPSTLYAWAGQGRIPCLKIHGLLRFRREEIDRWVQSFRAQVPPLPQKSHLRGPRTGLDELIVRAKRQAYNPRPRGNQTQSSPIGKETIDGAI